MNVLSSDLLSRVEAAFSKNGALAANIENYRARQGQLIMAQAVLKAIQTHSTAVIEAGTGTGKTFAYLVPALLAGGKVLISTASKNLQDQLFTKDLPYVRDALRAPVSVALLKGRSNYLCHFHMERIAADGRLASKEQVHQLQEIRRFSKESLTGDKSLCAQVPEEAPIWSKVTSTAENCLGSECPYFQDCFVMKARKTALQSEVAVINHHLFFADAALRSEGIAELLPTCNTIIFDEAHQIPDIATHFFGQTITLRQGLELSRDVIATSLAIARDAQTARDTAQALEKSLRDCRLLRIETNACIAQEQLLEDSRFTAAIHDVIEKLEALGKQLEVLRERDILLSQLFTRTLKLKEALEQWLLAELSENVRWLDVMPNNLAFAQAPLTISDKLQALRETMPAAWVLTSATLSVNGDFSHFLTQTGLQDTHTISLPSPFDYAQQALLYVPTGLPAPNHSDFTLLLTEHCLPLILALEGRTFFLCTSLRAMDRVVAKLRDLLKEAGSSIQVLAQGENSRSAMLEIFRNHPSSVLVGSASFWEGVDVRGNGLSMVIIDKLPFSPPDDPLFAARLKAVRKAGGNPFVEVQLPQAAIALKQGAGRLIRDPADHGLLVIGDARLAEKPYGKLLWSGLPPFNRTRLLKEAQNFAQELKKRIDTPAINPI
ncbi:MAG: ATP-dependent DNA helicase [Burkholderiaceae bacterium]|nr:ATP-dependent DNA helicase [Burkholderiaceae bacterium]